ncbi:TPA: PTS lactose/cellobiose transporter subunit IIA [Streptococcus suis]|nr:PTS lactose/cellobiose transporter subunit IIA [Streptococcus suis]HEM4101770.1 PTS lactose/cellobiose transporter subunit IIA [Streptococcus suis]
MNREEITLLGFEIVAFAGDARSRLMEALAAAQKGDYAKAEELVEAANACIVEAHHAQTSLLQKEAAGEDLAFSVTLMHGQDHLMTTLLLKDMMMGHMIELYKRGDK